MMIGTYCRHIPAADQTLRLDGRRSRRKRTFAPPDLQIPLLHGYRVCEADSAATGLAAALHTQPDLIILDLRLPDADGLEVLEKLRSWSNAPVIVLSIDAWEEVKVQALKSGADDYVGQAIRYP